MLQYVVYLKSFFLEAVGVFQAIFSATPKLLWNDTDS